jgi:excisionase family DNA binding protein
VASGKHAQILRVEKTKYEKQPLDGATEALLTKHEVATRLRRSRRTVDLWMRQKKLPYLKIGKSVLFRWQDVLEKLNAFRVN